VGGRLLAGANGGVGVTAGQAVVVPAAVFMWQVLWAARTFVHRPQDHSGLPPLFGLAFAALVFDSWNSALNPMLFAAGCVGLAAALMLFEWARRTIRGLNFSYIFSTDTPTFMCTSGPYAYIRNPFYASYLLTMGSTAVMLPSLFRLSVVVAMAGYLGLAAVREEKKFARSRLATEYAAYTARTGRFLPRISARRS
jgi:protein-S-isoprenylcysteine O-methyltransferase Ste14